MSKKISAIALIFAVIALGLSVYNTATKPAPIEEKTYDIQYVMILGTNDKDT